LGAQKNTPKNFSQTAKFRPMVTLFAANLAFTSLIFLETTKLTFGQGDQIGRIFANWVIV
jgi:hypothetical protein